MPLHQIIITLAGMATAAITLIKVAEVLSTRRKCECSRTGEFEKSTVRLDTVERDTQRNWDAIQDLYARATKATELYHNVEIITTKILTRLEK